VELTFSDDTNDYFARQLVLERLRDAELPDGVTPTLGPLSSGIGELYRYVVEGPGFDAMKLREIQDWLVAPRLLQVEGVADVVTFGGLVRQYQIELDPKSLDKYRMSVRQIADAVKNNTRNAGGALLTLGQQSLPIRGTGLIQSTEDIEAIVLDARGACRSSFVTSATCGSAPSRRPDSSASTARRRPGAGSRGSSSCAAGRTRARCWRACTRPSRS
jgi:cobalt-zinc-cadmium resistance protein CzcA